MSVSVSVQDSFQGDRLCDEPSMQPSDEWVSDGSEEDDAPEDERSFDVSRAQSYAEIYSQSYVESYAQSTVNKDPMTSLVDYFVGLAPTLSVDGSKFTDFGRSVVSKASSSVSEFTKPEKAKKTSVVSMASSSLSEFTKPEKAKKYSSTRTRCIIENPESIQERQDEQLRREGCGDERDDDMTSVEEISQISELTMDMPTVVTHQRFTSTKCSALPTISEANVFDSPPVAATCHSGVLRGKAHAQCAPTADTTEHGVEEGGDFLDFVFELVEDAVCKPSKTSKQERKEVFMEAFNKESERMLKLAKKNGAKEAFREESSRHSRTSTKHSRTSTGTKQTQDKPKDDKSLIDEAPVEEAPLDEAPLDEAPLDEAPLEETQLDETQLEETQLEETQLEETQLEEIPQVEASQDETPMEEASMDEGPLNEEAPIEEDPIEEAPVDEAPMDEAPLNDEAPMDETSVNECPMDETPMDEAPMIKMETSVQSVRKSDHSRMKIVDKPPIQLPGFNSAYPLNEEVTLDWSKMMSLAEKHLKADESSVHSHDSKMSEISGITETPSMFQSIQSMFQSVQQRDPPKKDTPVLSDEVKKAPKLSAISPLEYNSSPVSTPSNSSSTHATLPEEVVKELRELSALESSSFEEESRFVLTSKLVGYVKNRVKNMVPSFGVFDEDKEKSVEYAFDEVSVASIPSLRSMDQAEPTDTNRYLGDESEKEMMIRLVNYVAFVYVFVLWPSGVKRKETPEEDAMRKNMPKSLLQLVNQK